MATIHVDGKAYQTRDGENLLDACLSVGLNIPYFCWHPVLGSVGACRQCAVKVFKDAEDKRGMIVMSCMTPVKDGMLVSIDDPDARRFRAQIIEWLMLNHPHDCPVCDEGGECHLQDMTAMTGHDYRRTRFPKRTHRNQDLGPFINHEMNRCIQCYRCVRFYRDYAGGRDLDVFGVHDRVYFGRQADGALESEFSGNLVEVCPTGVFTDKTLKQHYTRKWDLQMAPSVCVHCGLGCNTTPGERYGTLRRIVNRYNPEVNRYFLCDRGRFGYEFVNSEHRLRRTLVDNEPVERSEAIRRVADMVKAGKRVIGIGSPRASLESNFALRQLVGPDRFYQGFGEDERRLMAKIVDILRNGPARTPSLADMEKADAVLVLGEDLTNSAPRMALALRQAVRNKPMKEIAAKVGIPEWSDAAARTAIQDAKGPLFIVAPTGGKLDDAAMATLRCAPNDAARVGFAVAHALNEKVPAVEGLGEEQRALVEAIAQALREAKRPLVVSGPSCNSEDVVEAAANVAWALCEQGKPCELSYVAHECNSIGLALLGGGALEEATAAIDAGQVEAVVILENDLRRRVGQDGRGGRSGHGGSGNDSIAFVLLDCLAGEEKRGVYLPAATFAEGDGILINNEGRAQRFVQVFTTDDDIQESWRWLVDVMVACGRSEAAAWRTHDDIVAAIAQSIDVFGPIPRTAPSADYRFAGQRIPREPHRYSGRTAMRAHVNVSEPKPPEDVDAPMTFTMEGAQTKPDAELTPFFWSPGWNSIQALNKFQEEIGGPLRGGSPGVRLIEPRENATVCFFDRIPPAFQTRAGEWLIVPTRHIFGSEELSVLSPAIAELKTRSHVGMRPEDAETLGLKEGDEVRVELAEDQVSLRLQIRPDLPRGCASMPQFLQHLAGLTLPQWAKIKGK
ncbi:MAG: NADH-quinone oxidoreductase subunit NuoG [Candidatus Sumerlaeota bacterium]|nr:NADH-quinone oxidoreductase subunit NuoG [Candidatus Sumerlaeota bacterium]